MSREVRRFETHTEETIEVDICFWPNYMRKEILKMLPSPLENPMPYLAMLSPPPYQKLVFRKDALVFKRNPYGKHFIITVAWGWYQEAQA